MRQSGYQDEQSRGSWHGWKQAAEPGWRSGSEREASGYGFEDEGRQGGFRGTDDDDRSSFRFAEPRQQYGQGGQRYGEGTRYGRGRYQGGDADWRGARQSGDRSFGDSMGHDSMGGSSRGDAGMEWGRGYGRGYGERHEQDYAFGRGVRDDSRQGGRSDGAEFSGSGSFWHSGSGSRQQSFRGRGPKGYERSDERLKEMICERLTEDDDIDPSGISIEVSTGEVTLMGTVPDRRTKFQVEELVESCGGVNEISNQLRIDRGHQSGQETRRGDGQESSQQSSQDSDASGAAGRRSNKSSRRSASASDSAESQA